MYSYTAWLGALDDKPCSRHRNANSARVTPHVSSPRRILQQHVIIYFYLYTPILYPNSQIALNYSAGYTNNHYQKAGFQPNANQEPDPKLPNEDYISVSNALRPQIIIIIYHRIRI